MTISTLEGEFTDVSPSFLTLTGYSREEVCTLGVEGVTSPGEWQQALDSRLRILKGDFDHFSEEKNIRRKDGRIIRARITCSLLTQEPPHFITFVEEFGAREALRESQLHRYAIFDNSGDAMLLFTDDGRYVEANHAAERIFGRSLSEIVGARIGSLAEHPMTTEERYKMLPVHYSATGRTIYIGFNGAADRGILYSLEQMLGCRTEPCIISDSTYNQLLEIFRSHNANQITIETFCSAREIASTICDYAEKTRNAAIRFTTIGEHIWMQVLGSAAKIDFVFARYPSFRIE